jgi:sigma-B regulation protein RsbU (phosphoserine phosphatase)
MSVTAAAARLGPATLTTALEALPEAVAVFDAAWTVCYINSAGAALVGRRPEDLVGRNAWGVLPEIAGSVFHSFLLHARGVGGPVTWRGFLPTAGRWLSATAVVDSDDLLHMSAREAPGAPPEGPAGAAVAAADGADDDRDRLRFLAQVSETMISTLNIGEAATRLAELAASRLCDWAIVTLAGEDAGRGEQWWAHRDPARRADLDTYLTGRLRDTGDDAPMVAALLSGAPVQLTAIDEATIAPSLPTEEVRAAWRRLALTSATIIPLRARGETFGVLALANCGDRPPHTETEIATAVEVARRGGLPLDNARLYGRQLTVAETLQHSLLTDPPEPDDLQIAVRYRPAGRYQHVGGDWYDAFTQPEGATLLVIGDVVGHDVEAAAAMGQIRSILRGIAYDRPETPAQVLTRVDSVLTGLHVGTLATALVARLEQSANQAAAGLRTLRWSSAGHLPPLLLRPDGRVQVLDSRPERLLGIDQPGRRRRNHESTLRPGDTVLLYTDGLVEHGHRDLDAGIVELADVLGGLAGVPLDELCDKLLVRLITGPTDDDIALLAVRCDPDRGTPAT